MTPGEKPQRLRLRPHHILCNRFLPLDLLTRGEEFASAVKGIADIVNQESDATVIITEGPDQLCDHCPDYRNGRCESPFGDEEKVSRWDAKIVEGLDTPYGKEITAKALLALIRERAPLDFCLARCPWKGFCEVSGIG